MITAISGKLSHVSGVMAYIMTNSGIEYEVQVLKQEALFEIDSDILLHVDMAVSQDMPPRLFGFTRRSDRDLFRILVSARGVGPQTGMNMLETYCAADLCDIIQGKDEKSLCKISGIGPKSAAKIILELLPKIEKVQPATSITSFNDPAARSRAVKALEALGWKAGHAETAINAAMRDNRISKGATTQEIIQAAFLYNSAVGRVA